ncbi:MAG: hypothetical protein ACFFFC_09820 [Candidatus Thorarchaeota archaeon]
MTITVEGNIIEIDEKEWAGVAYGQLKLELKDGSVLDLGYNQNTRGSKPKVGAQVWVEYTVDKPHLILRLSRPGDEVVDSKMIPTKSEETPASESIRKPKFIERPFGIMLTSVYIFLIGAMYLLLPGATSLFQNYASSFYFFAFVYTAMSTYVWRMKSWARWISFPLLAICIINFWWFGSLGVILTLLSSISMVYLLLPSTSAAYDEWID